MNKFVKIKNKSNELLTQYDSRGYSILKEPYIEHFGISSLDSLKKELLLVPKENKKSYGNDEKKPARCFRESPTRIYMPKFYGLKKFGEPSTYIESDGLPVSNYHAFFKGKLRPFQEEKHPKIFQQIKKNHGGVIKWGCGCGKTVYAIFLFTQLKRKCIILCHTTDLLNQWEERIQQFAPNVRIGRIQAQVCNYKDKDIVLATIQSIYAKDYPEELFKEFGTLFIDETHHIAASSFSKALFKMPCKYKIGLSATPYRPDGLDRLLTWTLGDVLDTHVQESKAYVKVLNIHHDYSNVKYNYRNEIDSPAMKRYIANHVERNMMGINEIVRIAEYRSRIIVIASLRKHCEEIHDELWRQGIETGLYYGNMKAVDLKESKTRKVIVGTFSMIEEGFDAENVDTVVLFSSVSRNDKLEQSIGRAFRKDRSGENPFESEEAKAMGHDIDYSKLSALPMIIVFNDNIPPFKWDALKNIRFFESKGYKIEHVYDEASLQNKKQIEQEKQVIKKTQQGLGDLAIFKNLKIKNS